MNHVMLDLETLATSSDAAILQLTAVEFDPATGEVGRTFNRFICDPSGKVDVATVLWWMQQDQAAHLGRAAQYGELESVVLAAFREWVLEVQPAALWSHGATFDIVVLANTHARAGQSKPWSYRIERDTRTLYDIARWHAVGCDATRRGRSQARRPVRLPRADRAGGGGAPGAAAGGTVSLVDRVAYDIAPGDCIMVQGQVATVLRVTTDPEVNGTVHIAHDGGFPDFDVAVTDTVAVVQP